MRVTTASTILLFSAASSSVAASSSSSFLLPRAVDAAAIPGPDPCAAAEGAAAVAAGGIPCSARFTPQTADRAHPNHGTPLNIEDVHLEKSRDGAGQSLGKKDARDPRSLRFQGSVFKGSTGRTGATAYDLGIRPRKLLEYERRVPDAAAAATPQKYAPSPAPGIGLQPPSSPGDPASDQHLHPHQPAKSEASATRAAHDSAPSATSTSQVAPLPFFPYSTSPMLAAEDYHLPTFASKPRFRTNPPAIALDASLPAERAKPRHKPMSKIAWNRLPSWSRVLLEDAVTLLNVPDAHGKVRRRPRSPFTGKWWRWAYGKGWMYGWSRDWSALESGRGPGVALAHLLPDRQVWTTTPPVMHWRFVFIASIAVPTFVGLIAALLLVQYFFFPHTLDFSQPNSRHHDGHVYIGLGNHDDLVAGGGPTLPFSTKHRRSRSRSLSGSPTGPGDSSTPTRPSSAAAMSRSFTSSSAGGVHGSSDVTVSAAAVTAANRFGSESGPSNTLLLNRRGPTAFRSRSIAWDAAVEMGETAFTKAKQQ
ncbi:hypothetical protein OC861_004530 [Tilletia horrida]|nr:hypothetical protein OC861_004530 [Tilletia horrida]